MANISDVLQQIRSGKPMYEQGLEAPTVDPVMVIASLMAPGIMSQLTQAAPFAASVGEPQAFSQGDMLLARLKANQPKIQQGMTQKTLPDFAESIDRSAIPIRPDFPSGTRPPMNLQEHISDPTLWDYMRPEPGSDVSRPRIGDFFEKYGSKADPQGHEAWIEPYEKWLHRSYNMSSQTSPEAAYASHYRSMGDPNDLSKLSAVIKHLMSQEGSGMDAVAALKRMRAASQN